MARTVESAPTLDESAVQALAATMRGPLIQRGDPGYDEARTVYNAMIDKHPALIAQCADVADVIAAVNFARDNDVLVAIRGGGHNGPGLGTCRRRPGHRSLADERRPRRSRQPAPPASRAARCWAICTTPRNAFGLATPSGIISTTGVGGITLGGGIGHLTRQFGLAIDNLLEADVVLADGSFVTASETEHPDLFWALRGGGGNFGVVTSFLFQLHPIPNLYAGPMLWPLERAAEVLRWYRDFITHAPDELNGFFAFLTVPPAAPFPEELWNQKMCGVVWSYTGDTPEETFAPIRAQFGPPALDWVGPIPHPALNSMFDGLYPAGDQWYWKADFVNEIPDEAVDLHVQYAEQLPTWKSTMHLYPIDGVAGRVPKDATAWNYRDAKWGMVIVGVSPDPADNPAHDRLDPRPTGRRCTPTRRAAPTST